MAICHCRKLGLSETDIKLLTKHYASRVSDHDSGTACLHENGM